VATARTTCASGDPVTEVVGRVVGCVRGDAEPRGETGAEVPLADAVPLEDGGLGDDVAEGVTLGFGAGVWVGFGVGVGLDGGTQTSVKRCAGGAGCVVPESPDPHDQPSTSPGPTEAEPAPPPAHAHPPAPSPCQ
jgi:hypothetical protein